jgi:hypothetical protein
MKHTPHTDYEPGHFTALIRKHNWPPEFVSLMKHDEREAERKQAAEKARQAASATGAGWGNGTIAMPNTPKWTAPKPMVRSA